MPAATAASLAACRRACSVEGEAPAGVAHATDASNSSATTYARVDQRVANASVEVSICRLPLWRGPSESLLLHLVRRNALAAAGVRTRSRRVWSWSATNRRLRPLLLGRKNARPAAVSQLGSRRGKRGSGFGPRSRD